MNRVLGLKCSRDALDWVVIEGADRQGASIEDLGLYKIPDAGRADRLCWVRKEIHELVARSKVDCVMLRGVEAGIGNPIPRAEIEGVVQEAVAASGLECRRLVAASLRSAFKVRNGPALKKVLDTIPAVTQRPTSRRDPVIAALVGIGAA